MTYTYIYRIDTVNYIGSTEDLQERERIHNSVYKNENDNNHYLKVYENCRELGIEYIKLAIIKRTKMTTFRKLEQYYINKYDSVNNGGNDRNAYVSIEDQQQYQQQYYQDHQEEKQQYNLQYRQDAP